MRVDQSTTFFIAHSGLKLVDPDARVDCHGFPLYVLQPGGALGLEYTKEGEEAHT